MNMIEKSKLVLFLSTSKALQANLFNKARKSLKNYYMGSLQKS